MHINGMVQLYQHPLPAVWSRLLPSAPLLQFNHAQTLDSDRGQEKNKNRSPFFPRRIRLHQYGKIGTLKPLLIQSQITLTTVASCIIYHLNVVFIGDGFQITSFPGGMRNLMAFYQPHIKFSLTIWLLSGSRSLTSGGESSWRKALKCVFLYLSFCYWNNRASGNVPKARQRCNFDNTYSESITLV